VSRDLEDLKKYLVLQDKNKFERTKVLFGHHIAEYSLKEDEARFEVLEAKKKIA
jgi:hypothetical protein